MYSERTSPRFDVTAQDSNTGCLSGDQSFSDCVTASLQHGTMCHCRHKGGIDKWQSQHKRAELEEGEIKVYGWCKGLEKTRMDRSKQ